MKKFLLFLLLFSTSVFSQDITGDWYGAIDIQGAKLRIVFHISESSSGYSATMDSPDQEARGIPVSKVVFENPDLKIESSVIGFEYNGKVNETFTEITGKFKQSGMELELNLTRKKNKAKVFNRPQEPKPPYQYFTKDVMFHNTVDNITLAGILSLPDTLKNYPAVVLISGSGPQNRDGEVFKHKIFLVLADYLTRNGIAVLRYDDRGVGKSEGNIRESTSENFAEDVLAAVEFLKGEKNIDANKIGLIGMSEGGMIAPIAAVKSTDISFIVLMAGPGIPITELLKLQTEAISRANGIPDSTIERNAKISEGAYKIILTSEGKNVKSNLEKYFRDELNKLSAKEKSSIGNIEQFINRQVASVSSNWFRYFIKYNPSDNLEKVECPVLALNGSKDMQVVSKENLAGIKKALEKGENKNYSVKELKGLNHLFQKCETGSPNEYIKIEETLNPEAMKIILDWIKSVTN